MLGVILILEEAWWRTTEESLGSQLHGIAEECKVDIGIEVYSQQTSIKTSHTKFARQIEMKGPALRLGQLGTDIGAVTRPAAEYVAIAAIAQQFGHLILTELVRGKELQASLDVFVETFEQGNANRTYTGRRWNRQHRCYHRYHYNRCWHNSPWA